MFITLRFAPRSTLVTTPLTGETNFNSGWFLSINKGPPAITYSCSFTTTLGVTPVKSSGTSE